MLLSRLGPNGMMAAVFAVAMVYASACSTTCALGACITFGPQTSTAEHHGDDHESSQPSGKDHHGPSNEDCNEHGHPAYFVKGPSAPQPGLSAQAGVVAASPADVSAAVWIVKTNIISGRDHAPPASPGKPLYQTISVLRI